MEGDTYQPTAEDVTVKVNAELGDIEEPEIDDKTVHVGFDVSSDEWERMKGSIPQSIDVKVDVTEGRKFTPPAIPDAEVKVNEVEGKAYTPPALPDRTVEVNEVEGDTYQPTAEDVTVKVNAELGDIEEPEIDDQNYRINAEQGDIYEPEQPEDKEYKVNAVQGTTFTAPDIPDKKVVFDIEVQGVDDLRRLQQLTGDKNIVSTEVTPKSQAASKDTRAFTASNVAGEIQRLKKDLNDADFGSELYNQISRQLADTTALSNLIKESIEAGVDAITLENIWDDILGDDPDAAEEELRNRMERLNEVLEEKGLKPLTIDFQTGNITAITEASNELGVSWDDAANAVRSVGSALKGIENPSIKVAGIVAEAVANIALAFAKSTTKDTKLGTAGWIVAATSGLATMISTISAIKSATAGSYEQGGIVPGHSYTGDRLTANVNSGELILSRAQQNTIAAQLSAGFDEREQSQPYVNGEMIYIGLNNYLKRTGRGEMITAKRR